jgi:hypothetical protein
MGLNLTFRLDIHGWTLKLFSFDLVTQNSEVLLIKELDLSSTLDVTTPWLLPPQSDSTRSKETPN